MSKSNVPSSDDSYRLWPQVRRVSKCPMRPKEYLEPPDDTFATLYALGFRKPGYSSSTSEALPAAETEDEELSLIQSPPPSAQPQAPVDTGPTETRKVQEPPTEPDFDGPLDDFEFPDD